MKMFPDENDFLSLFESEPKLFDSTTKDMPFYYNIATYQFTNGEEDFIVTLSPADGEVKIQVTKHHTNVLQSYLDFKCVDQFEIITDQKDHSSILLTMEKDEMVQTVEIDFKPFFKLIFKDHFLR
jgi:hypothetical protein